MPDKITIGLPFYERVYTKTMFCITQELVRLIAAKRSVDLTYRSSSIFCDSMNQLAEVSLANESSHILFIESDMTFPLGAVDVLLSRNKSIIGVHYNQRGEPLRTTVKIKRNNELYAGVIELTQEPMECWACGMGFMLIETDVFRVMPWPWFEQKFDLEKHEPISQDVVFCAKAHALGIGVWFDATMKIGHIGDREY